MGSIFFDLHQLVQMEQDGSLVCPFQKSYLDVTGDVVMKGKPAGKVFFKIRFRIISKEKEVSLRKRKEGNIVEADVALGIDAKKLVILSEESTIGVNKSFLVSTTTKILPTSIFNQEKAKATRLSKLIEDGSPKGKLEITLIRATNLPAVNRNDGKPLLIVFSISSIKALFLIVKIRAIHI